MVKILSSEITPYSLYLNRRKFIQSATAASIASSLSLSGNAFHLENSQSCLELKTYKYLMKSLIKLLLSRVLVVMKCDTHLHLSEELRYLMRASFCLALKFMMTMSITRRWVLFEKQKSLFLICES